LLGPAVYSQSLPISNGSTGKSAPSTVKIHEAATHVVRILFVDRITLSDGSSEVGYSCGAKGPNSTELPENAADQCEKAWDILVQKGLKAEQERRVLMHEIYHVMLADAALQPHNAIQAIASRTLKLMQENPELVNYLTQ